MYPSSRTIARRHLDAGERMNERLIHPSVVLRICSNPGSNWLLFLNERERGIYRLYTRRANQMGLRRETRAGGVVRRRHDKSARGENDCCNCEFELNRR